jgi:hypothetical protein
VNRLYQLGGRDDGDRDLLSKRHRRRSRNFRDHFAGPRRRSAAGRSDEETHEQHGYSPGDH